jgi:alkylation response protein AidB-like acyl-CoA dehydrogenase
MAFAAAGTVPEPLACAVAKARTSEVAQPVAQIAHAVHGAIGITQEFDLQLYTRRLHAWRIAAGSESYWNQRIGRALLASELSVPEFARTALCPL